MTIHGSRLWWGFAGPEVFPAVSGAPPGSRFRKIAGGWRSTGIRGTPLHTDQISSAITQTAAFRGTICQFGAQDRLIRLINGEESPAAIEARQKRQAFEASLVPMIRSLHQDDFEILTDLLFHRLGWQRIGALGGAQANTDLVLVQPATGQRAMVQVKSRATQAVIDEYARRLEPAGDTLVFWYVTHRRQTCSRLPQAPA